MGRAIWSATGSGMLNFPARFFVDFFDRHGFLNIDDRPVWRTVSGGSREYVRQMTRIFAEDGRVTTRVKTPVKQIRRHADRIEIVDAQGELDRFDYVFMACHSDQALAMLESPTDTERDVLGAFPYQPNDAILHTDTRVLPRKPLARAAWNYHLRDPDTERVCLTYDMNVLQSIESSTRFLVTLNRDDIDPAQILGRYVYDHPVYTPDAVRAQARRADVSGHHRSFYCGAYWRYGFHEDGVVSALWALNDFAAVTGGLRPPQPVLEPQRRKPA
jgi:predicted NAD/FAD-binding protein